MINPDTARVVRIENTLDLSEIWVSKAMIPAVESNPDTEVISAPFAPEFSDQGKLADFHAAA